MVCEQCKEVGVYHKYHTFDYYYCENCKEEISLSVPSSFVELSDSIGNIPDLAEFFSKLIRET